MWQRQDRRPVAYIYTIRRMAPRLIPKTIRLLISWRRHVDKIELFNEITGLYHKQCLFQAIPTSPIKEPDTEIRRHNLNVNVGMLS